MKNIKVKIWWGVACCFALYMVFPVLWEPVFCILDSSFNYDCAMNIKLSDPSTWFAYYGWRALPFAGLWWPPAIFGNHPGLFHWYGNGIILLIAVTFLFWIVNHTTKKAWLAAVAIIPALIQPTFVENYYTLFKQETLMLAGVLSFSYLLYCYVSGRVQKHSFFIRLLIAILTLLAAMYAFMKEPSVGFMGAVVIGTLLMGWEQRIGVKKSLKRSLWPFISAIFCFATVMYFYSNVKSVYGGTGKAEYVVSIKTLSHGLIWLYHYTNNTAPYVYVGMAVLGIVLILFVLGNSAFRDKMRGRIVWSLYLFTLCSAVITLLLPWSTKDIRYYIIFSTIMPVWTIISCEAGWRSTQVINSKILSVVVRALCVFVALLMILHIYYGLLLGRYSEGPVRHSFDLAYSDMYDFIANNSKSNSTVYFVFNTDYAQREIMMATKLWLNHFVDREDIKPVLVTDVSDFNEEGYVILSFYRRPAYFNYKRMPCHEKARYNFRNYIKNKLDISHVTNIVYQNDMYYVSNSCNVLQYKSLYGIPDFWDMKTGVYTFGWEIYKVDSTNIMNRLDSNLIKNSHFETGLKGWSAWANATDNTNLIRIVTNNDKKVSEYAVRIENPVKKMIGVMQNTHVVSGKIYKLSAHVRSVVTNNSKMLFGARIALFQKGQPEKQLVWMSEYNKWWRKELKFTNMITGRATVYCSMGYGNVASTGEFTHVRLEEIE